MKIKLLSREIEITIVNKNATELNPTCRGVSDNYNMEISVLKNNVSFSSLLHEIKHLHSHKCGVSQLDEITQEVDCDLFAACIEQLMIENGDDIFTRLKRFAEEK